MTEPTVSASPVWGPCQSWDFIRCVALPAGSEGVTGYAVEAATEMLWDASGQQFGFCDRTVRPCRRDCWGNGTNWGGWFEWSSGVGGWGQWPRPVLFDGEWFNLMCNTCPGSCSCTGLEVALLPAPVYSILQVKLNGEVMSTGSYRMDEDIQLVRTDGERWPMCQDMAAADTEDDTWSVTARFGKPVPRLGQFAMGELIAEIASACIGVDCRLPANIRNMARENVSITFSDSDLWWERLYFPKLFLQTVNPKNLSGRARVFDVDGPDWRRTNTARYGS